MARTFARVVGLAFVIIGVLGFLGPLKSVPPGEAPALTVPSGFGYLFGLFAVNDVHNVLHVLVGVGGIVAAATVDGARGYARALAWIYGALAMMGVLPGFATLFGLAPLFGHDVWLHTGIAVVAASVGYRHRRETGEMTDVPGARKPSVPSTIHDQSRRG
jgi:hypothetical protein